MPSIDPKFQIPKEVIAQFPGVSVEDIGLEIESYGGSGDSATEYSITAVATVNGVQRKIDACPRPCGFVQP